MKNSRRLLITDGALVPHRAVDPSQVEGWRKRLKLSKPHRIGVLLGGPARNVEMASQDVESVMGGLIAAAEESDAELLITSSRRTPPAIENWLRMNLKRHPLCRLLVLVNGAQTDGLGNTAEAVPCILELAGALVVSGDSISMVSEAAATGKPVICFSPRPMQGKKAAETKYHRFLRQMDDQGRVRLVEPVDVGEAVLETMKRRTLSAAAGSVEPDPIVEFLRGWF